MSGLEFLDKAIGDGLKLALSDLMGEVVAKCDVCGNHINRAESFVATDYGITFGCTFCAFGRGPRETTEPAQAPPPATTLAPEAPKAVKEPVSLSRGILARPTAETQRPVVNARAQGEAVRRKPGRPRKVEAPPEPEATIEVEPPAPVAAPEPEVPTTVVCTTCQRTLPERLLAMHRANCERANAGIS